MITRIELKNFMSHQHTVIEPARGLTVISGPNNCGKSAIVAALQILCYNEDSTFVTRHGEKDCSIKVSTHDGHEIEWQRNKNKSTKYIIDGQQFDRLGRGGTPDVLHEILGIRRVDCDNQDFDVHFGAQKQPVFLLNDSPRAAAQFFASSSDANNLIAMQTLHKQKVRDNKSTKKRMVAELNHSEQQLEALSPVNELLEELEQAESQYKQLVASEEEAIAIHNQTMAISSHTRQQQQLETLTETLQPLTAVPTLPPTQPLEALINQIQQNRTSAMLAGGFATALEKLASPPVVTWTSELTDLIESFQQCETVREFTKKASSSFEDIVEPPELLPELPLRNVVTRLQEQQQTIASLESLMVATAQIERPPEPVDFSELQETVSEIIEQVQKVEKLNGQVTSAKKQLTEAEAGIENWIASNPSCPTCGGALTTDQLLDPNGGHCHG